MNDASQRGQFIWHELMTKDLAGSRQFYRQALGWNAEASPANPRYHLFSAASGMRGGAMQLAEAELSQGARAGWLVYIGTSDINATVSAATVNGGGVIKGITDIPGVARFAVLRDPQGAVFGVYQTAASHMVDGGYAWHELATTDIEAALEFYKALFGWAELQRMNMGAQGTYLIFGIGARQLGGIYRRNEGQPMNYWLPYASVDDFQAAVGAARAAGANFMIESMQVPGGGWISLFSDPQGAVFAVHAMAVATKSEAATRRKPAAKRKAVAKRKAAAKPKPVTKRRSTAKRKPMAKRKSVAKRKRIARKATRRSARRVARKK